MLGKSGIIVNMRRITNWTANRKEWKGIDLLEALEYLDKYGYKLTSSHKGKITGQMYLTFTKPNCATTYEVKIIDNKKGENKNG